MVSEFTIPNLLTTPEAAKFLRVSESFLEGKRWSGGGPKFIRQGRKIVYDASDLNDWLDAGRRSSTSQTTTETSA